MNSRRCGYCRSGNHRSDKCNEKINQITAVRRHFYHERAALHKIMIDNGMGVGSMLQMYNGELCVVRSLRDSFDTWNNSFLEWRNIKYQKSVRAFLRSYSGINHSPDVSVDHSFVRYDPYSHFYIVCSPINDLSSNVYGTVCMSALPNPPPENAYVKKQMNDLYYRERSVKILSPSDETDIVDREFFNKPFRIHERLGKDKAGNSLLVDPII